MTLVHHPMSGMTAVIHSARHPIHMMRMVGSACLNRMCHMFTFFRHWRGCRHIHVVIVCYIVALFLRSGSHRFSPSIKSHFIYPLGYMLIYTRWYMNVFSYAVFA